MRFRRSVLFTTVFFLVLFSPYVFSQGIKCSINGVPVSCNDTPSSSGGVRRAPSGPSAADLARQRAQQAEFARQEATKQAVELKGAGYLLTQKGDHKTALTKFEAALKLLLPYENNTYNDSVKELYDVRMYISVSEAHVAEASGNLDLAISKLDRLCGTLSACTYVDQDYYNGLKEKRNRERAFGQNKPATSSLLSSLAAEEELEQLQRKKEKTSALLNDLQNRIPNSSECDGTNSAKCQLNSAAGNSTAANINPTLTAGTKNGIPVTVKPPEGPAEKGPGAVAGDEGSKAKAGCWADGTGNCGSTAKPPVPAPVGATTAAKLPIPPGLAAKPEFRELLRKSSNLTEQIKKIDARLAEIKKQRDSGTANRAALDKERYDLMNKETQLNSQRRILDNKIEDEKKNYSVGFDEANPNGSGTTKPGTTKPGAPKKKP